ncbi:MAG: acetyl-CoA hydrolase/transferase family protein [Alphaproteobacteria bacterium]
MPKVLDAAELDMAALVRPGDTVAWGQGTGEPLTLSEALVAQRASLGGGVSLLLGTQFSRTVRPEHADHLHLSSFGGGGRNRALVAAGVLHLIPCHWSDTPRLFARGALKADVVFVQASGTGPEDVLSLSTVSAYMSAAMRHARTVVAELNEQAPWTFGTDPALMERVDYVVRTSRPLMEEAPAPVGAMEQAIAAHVGRYIEDGCTLQLGVGAIPDAVLATLFDRRRLGVHSGVIGDRVVDLIESGVVDNSAKPVDAGTTITSLLFGTRRLFDFAHRNPALRVESFPDTYALDRITRMPRLVCLNSAIEVDLTGQLNTEIAGDRHIGTVGALGDVLRIARMMPDSTSIIALPSATGDGSRSRIVSRLAKGIATSPRTDTDIVITEHGVAELAGQPVDVRARRMIAVADPRHRETLERAAREDGLI